MQDMITPVGTAHNQVSNVECFDYLKVRTKALFPLAELTACQLG